MKKNQWLVGLILALALLTAVGSVGYLFYVGPRFDASSKAYMDQNVPIILSRWSEQALWERAAPELKRVVTEEQLKGLFGKFSGALGNLKTYEGSSGEATIAFLFNKGQVVSARYTAKTSFENGPALIDVGLIEHEGQWQILRFYVNSPGLLK